jgi:hypothetical protein
VSPTLPEMYEEFVNRWSPLWGVIQWIEVAEQVLPPVLESHFLKTSEGFKSQEEFWRHAAKVTHEESVMAVQASLLVLTHSLLDDVSKRIMGFSIATDAKPWESRIVSKDQSRYTLNDVLHRDSKTILDDASKRYLTSIERMSLPNRIALLSEVFRPGNSLRDEDLHPLSAAEIKELDIARHGIVHGQLLGRPFPRFKIICGKSEDTLVLLILACARFHQIDMSDSKTLTTRREMKQLVRQSFVKTQADSA